MSIAADAPLPISAELSDVGYVIHALAHDAERLQVPWETPETIADAMYVAEQLRATALKRLGRRVFPTLWQVDLAHLKMAQMLITIAVDEVGDDQKADRLPVVGMCLYTGIGVALWQQVDATWMAYVANTRHITDLDTVPVPELGFLPEEFQEIFADAFDRQLAKRNS